MTHEPRLGPPPIEPLSEVAWSRVERGLWSQLDAGRPVGAAPAPRRWWLVAAPLAAAAAVIALVIATRGGPDALADEPYRVVSESAPTSVSFGDSHIALDAATALVMRHEDAHPTVMLERGAAWFTVAPRLARPAFTVRAGDAMVRVVGTRFRVARSDERIAVVVDHGMVEVNFRGGVVAVGAGQRWSSDVPAKIVTSAAAPPSVDPVVAAAQPADASTAAPAPASPAPPPAAAPSAPSAHAAPAPAAVIRRPSPPSASGAAHDRAEYDRLAALEVRSPEAALTGYVALAQGTSRWAAPALYAAARLAADRHDRRAPTLLAMYLTRFPSGANAADARKLLAGLAAPATDRP